MKQDDKKLKANEKTWDEVAEQFSKSAALPYWGPYHASQNSKNLIGKIKGNVLLEIGCGSGRSINYLMERGAKRIYGLDFSEEQIKIAENKNSKWISDDKVKLYQDAMEKKIKFPEKIDIVYSIYALGWTFGPDKTLGNIYSYLKPGGRFVWSWEHPDFNRTIFKNGKVIYDYSYFDKEVYHIKNWKDSTKGAYLYPRTVSFWFDALKRAGFAVVDYLEPEPEYFSKKHRDLKQDGAYYYYKKAKIVPSTMIFVCEKPK